MGYDLEFRTMPGRLLSPSEFDQLIEAFRNETDLDGPCEITEHSSEPDNLDLTFALELCHDEDKSVCTEFEAYCAAHHVDAQVEGPKLLATAYSFQVAKRGQEVFFLKLPPSKYEDEVRDAYRKIVDFARRHHLIVDDPQVGHDIDLEAPGEFPPMWGPTRAERDAAAKRK